MEVLLPLTLSIGLFLGMEPSLWIRDTIPALTDLPGHLLPPILLADQLLPQGALRGWSFDWFAGFPLYQFYFPLPGLLVAIASRLVDDAVALRIAAMGPVLLMPWCVWGFARLSGMGPALRAGVTVVGSSLVLMTSHWYFGANILAAVVGEFSYGWSVAFLVLYLGLLSGPPEARWRGVLAGVALVAALLSHIVPVMAAFLAMLPFLLVPGTRRRVVESGIVAAVLGAFWLLPMAARISYVGSKAWAFAPAMGDVFPLELVVLLPGAAYGLTVARRHTGLAMLISLGAAALLLSVVPQELVHRGRLLPLWYLAVHVLAGAGLVRAVQDMGERGWRAARLATAVGVVGTGAWLFVLTARGIQPDNWRDAMSGISQQPGAQELDGLVDRLRSLPPGRIHWEAGEALSRWGGVHAFSLLPYWTDHQSLLGLWAESSPASAFIPILDSQLSPEPLPTLTPRDLRTLEWNPVEAVERLQHLGVRYLVTHSEETTAAVTDGVAPPLASFGSLRLFDLGPAPLVTTLRCWEAVPEGRSLHEAAVEAFVDGRPGGPPLVAGLGQPGEAGGPRPACGDPSMAAGTAVPADSVQAEGGTIRFRADATGVPHLIRVSYFPNWRARGAEGPFPASPWFMVVVPTEETVTLDYGSGLPERLGWIVTWMGAGVLAVGGVIALRRRRREVGAHVPHTGDAHEPPDLP
jgi:hypothetical protein